MYVNDPRILPILICEKQPDNTVTNILKFLDASPKKTGVVWIA